LVSPETGAAHVAWINSGLTPNRQCSFCEGFTSFGTVDVQSAQIEGNLVSDGCKLAALYCANMTLKGDLQRTGIRDAKSTPLALNGATVKSLRDERESWPRLGGLHLDGFQYGELTLHSVRTEECRRKNELGREHPLKIEDRVEWLNLQPTSDQAEQQPIFKARMNLFAGLAWARLSY
jgi:hypothetical protein